jgi:hypothetical protein
MEIPDKEGNMKLKQAETTANRAITWKAAAMAAIAGVLGTVAFDLFGLVATGQWWDIPGLLGAKIGVGLVGGVLAHYGNGVLLAIIFAALLPLFWGPYWLRALQFITLQTIFGVWLFMMPLLGMGALGLTMGAAVPVISLLRHWAYGIVVGLIYARLTAACEPRSAPGA